MYIITGLGNPTPEYRGTRHNVGFAAIDRMAEKMGCSVLEKMKKAHVGSGRVGSQKVLLAKPQTYMNLSGESVRALADFYKIDPESELIVICDDINLPPGKVRIRAKGSAGGHNGLKNIILNLGTDQFIRVRVGVGARPDRMDLADYVLGRPSGEDRELMEEGIAKAAEAALAIVTDGVDAAMNKFN
ncbi:MAG: aminoacyl-tRNA hydrolase [Lachnospiraceae bacterium]|nr:aminoacyl-tRNA hydrolase [Lachnospiraceae bacterium]